jgi:hypothetical protein
MVRFPFLIAINLGALPIGYMKISTDASAEYYTAICLCDAVDGTGVPSNYDGSHPISKRQDFNANYFATKSADLLSVPSRHIAEQLTYIDAVSNQQRSITYRPNVTHDYRP